ncbi:MAG: two-component sensor histidine kinase, partial [Phyllobacteriaceae bacterium]|nr:two-component sensor histidine kinase [Phyllobacteriaceae bacterium]
MSLRRSLILAFSIVLTIVGVLSAIYAYESSRKEVRDLLDLQQRQIAHLVGNGGGFADGANQKADLGNEDGYTVEIRFADGRPTRASRPGVAFPETITPGFSDFRDAAGDWRLFTLIDDGRTVRVAQFLAERGELATDAAITAALPMLVAIPLSWLIVWALVGAIVGRLEPVVAQVERREADDTDPIDLGRGPTELRPLVDAMNRAFARQRAAAEQQKQFLSDAAHELRTPLTALTLQIDNLRRANADRALDGPLDEANAGIRRASALTSRLLQLARQEAHATPRSTTEVRLDD